MRKWKTFCSAFIPAYKRVAIPTNGHSPLNQCVLIDTPSHNTLEALKKIFYSIYPCFVCANPVNEILQLSLLQPRSFVAIFSLRTTTDKSVKLFIPYLLFYPGKKKKTKKEKKAVFAQQPRIRKSFDEFLCCSFFSRILWCAEAISVIYSKMCKILLLFPRATEDALTEEENRFLCRLKIRSFIGGVRVYVFAKTRVILLMAHASWHFLLLRHFC